MRLGNIRTGYYSYRWGHLAEILEAKPEESEKTAYGYLDKRVQAEGTPHTKPRSVRRTTWRPVWLKQQAPETIGDNVKTKETGPD